MTTQLPRLRSALATLTTALLGLLLLTAPAAQAAPFACTTIRSFLIRISQLTILSAVGYLWIAPANALSFDESLVFRANNQSQWTSGPAGFFSTGGPQFLGIPGFSEGKSIGGIIEECDPILGVACVSFGAKIGAEVSGRVGFNYDVVINSGSLSVTFPQKLSFTLPDPGAVVLGNAFDIKTTLSPSTTVTIFGDSISAVGGPIGNVVIKPSLQTIGPTVQAFVDTVVQAHFGAIAQVCVVTCYGPRLDVGVDKTQELLALNYNNDGQLRVLGAVVGGANVSTTVNKGSLNIKAQLPVLNSDSRVSGGFDGTQLTSRDRGNVLALSANLDKIISDLLGLPPLNGQVGPFGYNILTANAGLTVDVRQNFSFDPDLLGTLNFSSPVIPKTGGVFNAANATSSVPFRVGDTVTLRAPGTLSLGVAPSFNLDNLTRNDTGLRIGGDVFVSAGGVSGFGHSLGPLYEEKTSGDLADIPLFGSNFRVNVPTIRTDPFNVVFGLPPLTSTTVNEDPCYLSLNSNNCDKSGYIQARQPCFFAFNCNPATQNVNQVYQIGNLYDLVDTSPEGNDCVRFDGLGRPCGGEFVDRLISQLLALQDTTLIGDTSPFLRDLDGDSVFLSDLGAFLASELLPVLNDTDLSSAQSLAGLGFSNDFAAFDVPAGAPFPSSVPEPGTLLLLLLGLAGLGNRIKGLLLKGSDPEVSWSGRFPP